MNGRQWKRIIGVAVVILILAASPVLAGPLAPEADLGTAFTYQGRLLESDAPAAGPVDLIFALHSHATADVQLGLSQTIADQELVDGYFTVQLDFGDVFDNTALWLDVQIRPGAEEGAYTPLEPRQALMAVPQAQFAQEAQTASWTGITGLPGGFDDDVDDDTLGALTLCDSGDIAAWNGSAWACAEQGGGGSFWSLSGNSGTTPGTHVLGTTDNVGLHLAVNNDPVLRLLPGASSPNIVGGYDGNAITAGVSGAFIGAGGYSTKGNTVTDDWGIVVGGTENTAGLPDAVLNNASYAVVVGGQANEASGSYAFVGGGSINEASGGFSTVPGGMGNSAVGEFSLAMGFRGQALHDGAFVWSDSTDANFDSAGDDTFNVRTTGGAHFFVGDGDLTVADTPLGAPPPVSISGDGVTVIDSTSAGLMLDVSNAGGPAIAGTSGTGSSIGMAYSPAVLGNSQYGIGVAGLSHSSHGIIGETDAALNEAAGVYGHNRQTAGYRNYGVMGESEATIGVGVYGTSAEALGYGVRAENTHASGVALDVSGSGIIQSTAPTVIKANPLNAVVTGKTALVLNPSENGYLDVTSTSAGEYPLLIPVDVPAQLYGRAMSVYEVEIWYKCESSSSYINITTLRSLQAGTATTLFTEGNNQTSITWKSYTLSSSATPVINGSTFLRLDLTFDSTAHYILIGEITLKLVQD